MRHEILRTLAGPMEWELRISHRYNEELFFYFDQFDDEKNLEDLVKFGTHKLLNFIINQWYQDHGNGD